MEMNNINRIIAKDLKKMNSTMTTKYIRNNYSKKNKLIKADKNVKKIRFTRIKYNLPKITLEKKYLKKYNTLLDSANYNILYLDLLESGYYMYDLKLKQHLSRCGLNRIKQLYGTCWLDSLVNSFIYGSNIRLRLLKLINIYAKNNKIKDIKKFVDKINQKKIKLSKTVDKNKKKIFLYLISILYTVFCDTGMRNTSKDKHDNFILTNFAINIRNYNIKKRQNLLKGANIAYNSYYALEHIVYIFNMMIDKKSSHLHYHQSTNDYSFVNKNHLNQLYFTIGTDNTTINGGYGYYYDFKNIEIKLNSKKIKFTSGNNIRNIDIVDFLIFSCTDPKNKLRKQIPKEITCTVNNVKTIFKLESASISIDDKGSIGHALTGLICNKEYYIYDPNNNYFKIDWTNLTYPNIKRIINYYKIIFSANHTQYNNSTNKTIMSTSAKKYIERDLNIYIEYATYYNSKLDFSFKMEKCNPKRPE
jgi:hypothetical protein